MHASKLLVVGTGNRKKGRELADLLAPLGLAVRTLAECPGAIAVEENGQTFAENAVLKATQQARHLGHWVLADDSGLEVEALGGAPGVKSARYSGPDAADTSNNQRLLAELAHVPLAERGARFVCHMALADPSGAIRAQSEGRCRGRILLDGRGPEGFGYDPLFEILEYHRSFGELGSTVKSVLSHRARAVGKMLAEIAALLQSGQW